MNEKEQKENPGKGHDKEVTIIVNGTPKTFEKKDISYEEVVILAYGNFDPDKHSYTVTYKMGQGNKPGGNLVLGGSVKVNSKMIFNVSRAIRS